MKKTALKIYRWLLAAMGFATVAAGCDELQNIIDPVCMYGMPHMDYTVTGKVTNNSGKPIQGIEVSDSECPWQADTTDANGAFSIVGSSFPKDSVFFSLKDIDGAENGDYADKTVGITLTKIKDADKDDTWYYGEYEAKDVTFKMDLKVNE